MFTAFLTTLCVGGMGSTTVSSVIAPSSLVADTNYPIDVDWTNNDTYDTILVERKTTGAYSQIASIDGSLTEYQDSNVVYGINYTYRVRGVKNSSNSDYSNESTTTLDQPVAPDTLTTTAGVGLIDLAWMNHDTYDNVYIERRVLPAGFVQIHVSTGSDTTYEDASPTGGSLNSYRVRGKIGSVFSNYSNISGKTPL